MQKFKGQEYLDFDGNDWIEGLCCVEVNDAWE